MHVSANKSEKWCGLAKLGSGRVLALMGFLDHYAVIFPLFIRQLTTLVRSTLQGRSMSCSPMLLTPRISHVFMKILSSSNIA